MASDSVGGDDRALEAAYAAIDAANSRDPKSVAVDGRPLPANLVYGRRMSEELARFAPAAGTALRIAARGQHIERWVIPRASYPLDRAGYHRWRITLRDHHAARLAEILGALGFEAETIARVGSIVRKERLVHDPEVQVLEDVACIVFLKYELAGFLDTYAGDEAKLAGILAKTWRKMSPAGHAAVLALPPPPAVLALLERGLAALGEGRAP